MSSTAVRTASFHEQPLTGELSAATLLRVFLRSLLLQASWNPQGMQNLGLAYALFPALKSLYRDQNGLGRVMFGNHHLASPDHLFEDAAEVVLSLSCRYSFAHTDILAILSELVNHQ